MSEPKKPTEPESYGPEVLLRRLEEQGLGDGPLARAFRRHIADPRPGSLLVSSPMMGASGGEVHIPRANFAMIEEGLMICRNLLVEAIEDGFSKPLNPEILNRIDHVLSELRYCSASDG